MRIKVGQVTKRQLMIAEADALAPMPKGDGFRAWSDAQDAAVEASVGLSLFDAPQGVIEVNSLNAERFAVIADRLVDHIRDSWENARSGSQVIGKLERAAEQIEAAGL